MLNKSSEKSFEEKFKNPDKEYRAAPFWSWNDRLDKNLLKKQIDHFKEMGFGGFYMHPRGGMETPYMSEEYIDAIAHCIKAAEQNDMFACLYDEDRWPSGFAGGLVTKTAKYRQRAIYITNDVDKLPSLCQDKEKAIKDGEAYLVGCYDVCLSEEGDLKSYRCIAQDEEAEFTKYFAYSKTDELSGKYNNQTYTDIMQKDAIKEFISVTHNVFYEKFGDKYGKTVANIFSDEPRHRPLELINPADENEIVYYWTYDFPETFKDEYGYDIVDRLPKIIWDEEGTHSYERYDFFEHVTRRTEEAFFMQIKDVLEKQGLEYSGHLMLENELYGQLRWGGDIMRYYPYFDIPGIDLLFDNIEFVGAKQVQSIVHQYGKKAMLSELYGVTGWDFDFKCLKMQGDWQAALGVNVRVPHLSMYSMKGAAKRDYPSSFNYQAPWFKEYKNIEDHFARINMVFENSKPIVDVAVLHPIETVMLTVNRNSAGYICKVEEELNKLVNSLLYSNIDFDFINEANLYTQSVTCTNKLSVGNMSYSVVIVPPVKTMRKNTVEIFNRLIDNGVSVIFIGECPQYVDGKKNDEVKDLYKRAKISSGDKLIAELDQYRHIKISCADKSKCNKIIYRLAESDDAMWLFIARAEKVGKSSKERSCVKPEKAVISIKGEYGAEIYDTLSGEIRKADYSNIDGNTHINYDLYANDSLLLKLSSQKQESEEKKTEKSAYKMIIPEKVTYKRHEDNCIVLDMGSYSVDGVKYSDIRSEIWGIISAGNPKLASQYAYMDACLDHADNSVYAEQFLAVVESMAFFENDINKLVDIGMEFIPQDSKLSKCFEMVLHMYKEGADWQSARKGVLDKYSHPDFTNVVQNLGFVLIALLWGKGDMRDTINVALRCGYDTDCTCASAASIVGIIKGYNGLDSEISGLINDYFICGIDIERNSDSIKDLAVETAQIAMQTPNYEIEIVDAPIKEQRPDNFEGFKLEYPTESGLEKAKKATKPVKWEIYGPYFDQLDQPINPDFPSPHGEGCVLPDLVCMVNSEVFLDKEYLKDFDNVKPAYIIEAYEDFIDTDSVFTLEGQMCCYARTKIYSTKKQKVWAIAGNNDGFRLTVNGETVLEKDEMRLWTPYNNFTLITLNEGENEIVIKLLRRTEKLKFSLGLRTYDGNHWHRSKWCTDLS